MMKLKVKKLVIALAILGLFFLLKNPKIASAVTTPTPTPAYVATEWQYDSSVWDKTDYTYAGEYVKLQVKCTRYDSYHSELTNKLIGLVYLFPTIFQSNSKIDGRIYQCVAFVVKSKPQSFDTLSDKYVGMTQWISVSLSNIHDEDKMFNRIISPQVTKEETKATKTYSVQTGSSWGVNGKVSKNKEGWTGEGGGSYNYSAVVSNQTTYEATALTVSTRDYVENTQTAEWDFDYVSEAKGNGQNNRNFYLVSATSQSGSLAWQGEKDVNYYYSNFVFSIEADFGLAKRKTNDRITYKAGNYVFGSNSTSSNAYSVYDENWTVYAK